MIYGHGFHSSVEFHNNHDESQAPILETCLIPLRNLEEALKISKQQQQLLLLLTTTPATTTTTSFFFKPLKNSQSFLGGVPTRWCPIVN